MKLKKGDNVQITIGKDKGKQGDVQKVYPARSMVLVNGVNEYKRHVKKNVSGQASEIVTITKPLDIAKVALICPKCKKQTRVGYITGKTGKVRICRKCKKEV